ncbi:MAG: hypothetical protein QXR45_13800, partial [Candidatus Bathyarchaeia archaeon]
MKNSNVVLSVLLLQVALYVSVQLDIPVFRQFLGFMCLSFVPGFLILKLFKLEELNQAEAIILNTGLSLAFLMLFGLLINELLPL